MKNTKKIASVLMALVMIFALATSAFAAGNGSITINKANDGETYSIYRIFDLESHTGSLYAYTLNSAWAGFKYDAYFTVNTDGYIEIAENADTAAFITAALAYAADNSITPVGSKIAANETIEFTGLDLGYYLVDSTMGSLCILTTTDPDTTVEEKNVDPTLDKTVEEDSTGTYGDHNDADIGQVVNYKTVINVTAGTENYLLYDTMSAGLTFNNDIAIAGATLGTDYTIETCEGHTFCIKFANAYIAKLAGQTITVTYSATVNSNAVAGTDETNTTYLSYGAASSTTKDVTTTATHAVKIFKYTGENTPLAGAEFILYKDVAGTKNYAIIANGQLTGWTTTETDATKLTSGADGYINISGLDADTYYLQETAAPAGYNLLKAPIEFSIDANGNTIVGGNTVAQVEIQNNAGTLLPETGGMGTVLFTTFGILLVLGTAVLMVTKRRMSVQ